jgi:hypothetical protein
VCGSQLYLSGEFVYTKNPAEELLTHFCREVARKQSVAFSIPKKSVGYKTEISFAKQILVACEGNLEFTKKVITRLLFSKGFSWKNRSSLRMCVQDLHLAIAEERSANSIVSDRERKSAELFEKLKEGVFS